MKILSYTHINIKQIQKDDISVLDNKEIQHDKKWVAIQFQVD